MDPVLNAEYIGQMVEAYASGLDLTDPFISPLFGDFEGFPPTFIQVGENEILLDDSLRLKERMEKAQVSVRMEIFSGMWHVFQMTPFKTAYEAVERFAEFVYGLYEV